MSDTCLRCNTPDMIPYGHWRICPNCEKDFLRLIEPHLRWPPVIELKDKGLPSKAGG